MPDGAGLEAHLPAAARPTQVGVGRPVEHRDLRAQRGAALRVLVTVAFALIAGAVTALFLQRCGGAGAP